MTGTGNGSNAEMQEKPQKVSLTLMRGSLCTHITKRTKQIRHQMQEGEKDNVILSMAIIQDKWRKEDEVNERILAEIDQSAFETEFETQDDHRSARISLSLEVQKFLYPINPEVWHLT